MTTPAELATGYESPQNAVNPHLHLRLAAPVTVVWHLLTSPEGAAAWLGEGAVLGGKGESYECVDGTAGVVRSFHPLEQLRLSWHPGPDVEPSLIEIDLAVEGTGTGLRLWHDGLPEAERPVMLALWQERMEAFADLVPGL